VWKFLGSTTACLILGGLLWGCGRSKADPKAEAPPSAVVEHDTDLSIVQIEHPEQFPLVTAAAYKAAPELVVTGAVAADASRNVPVISLASGRVVDIRTRLGDTVQKGQVLVRVQSADVSATLSDYRKALADETLAKTQFDRSNDLFEHGAISMNDVQVAQDTDDKAKVDVENTRERLRILGVKPDAQNSVDPAALVDIVAPVSGVIVEQNVTQAAGVKTLDNSPNLFTIADLSQVWILCDVYENDLPEVRLGDTADIHLNAYPRLVIKGKVANIGAVLDPSMRTAKVRIEVANPGMMRVGMFVTATFHGQKPELYAEVPASAILHLHDRDWVFVRVEGSKFKRTEVASGPALPNGMQEILSGIQPGQSVVANALALGNTSEQ
jgi:cobalt-zinc-cadmium efflux system membrane fusion protein